MGRYLTPVDPEDIERNDATAIPLSTTQVHPITPTSSMSLGSDWDPDGPDSSQLDLHTAPLRVGDEPVGRETVAVCETAAVKGEDTQDETEDDDGTNVKISQETQATKVDYTAGQTQVTPNSFIRATSPRQQPIVRQQRD